MKIKWFFWLVAIVFLVSCQNRNKAKGKATETVMVEEEGLPIHAPMSYFDFDKLDNLVAFFDSISQKHHIPIWMPEEDDTKERVKQCIARIEAYRKGKARFYPDSLVSSCLKSIGFNTTYSGAYPFNFRWRIQSQNRVK